MCICGSLLQRQMRDRDLFDIVVGEEKTLAKFLLDNGGAGHRTERSGRVRVSVSRCCRGRGKPQEGVALWRERPFGIVVRKLETLAFFQKWYVLKDTHRPEGRPCVYMWVSAAEAGERQRPFGYRRWGGENAREIFA